MFCYTQSINTVALFNINIGNLGDLILQYHNLHGHNIEILDLALPKYQGQDVYCRFLTLDNKE